MKIVEVDRLVPAGDEILVRVYAASVNPADYIVRQGENEGLKPLLKLNMGLRLDAAGIVKEMGSKVTAFKKGDHVYGVLNYLGGGYTRYLAGKSGSICTDAAGPSLQLSHKYQSSLLRMHTRQNTQHYNYEKIIWRAKFNGQH